MTTETIIVAGWPRQPWYKKINPIWWFGNVECKPTDTFNYCYIRNPVQNFRDFVIGITDREHTVTGPKPADQNLWTDVDPNLSGWKWAIVGGFLPYISYSRGRFAFYLGWMPMGRFGFRLTL